MRTAIVTANFGQFDEVYPAAQQSLPTKLFYFTEKNTPYPMDGLSNRLRGKFFKMQAHRVPILREHQVIIWTDASIEIISPDFVADIQEKLKTDDFTIGLHPDRTDVIEELSFIQQAIRDDGSPYLRRRYMLSSIEKELDLLAGRRLPLYACSLFAYRNTAAIRGSLNQWWNLTMRYSELDQCMFSLAFSAIPINTFPYYEFFEKGLITKHAHGVDGPRS
jgi:hypothetical protein